MAAPAAHPRQGWRNPRYRPRPSGKAQGSAVGGGKSPYRLGRDFERATRGRLERRGYFVMRSTLSKGKIDLLAVKGGSAGFHGHHDPKAEAVADALNGALGRHIVLGVQCKRRGDIGSAEWNALIDLCEPYGITPVVTMKTGERTVAFYRLDERRVPRAQGRPWTEIDPATGEPTPVQLAI